MYLPNEDYVYNVVLQQSSDQKGEELLIGQYSSFTFPSIYKGNFDMDSIESKHFYLTHFLKTNYRGRNFAVAQSVVKLLRDNNISGWSTYPVNVYTNDNVLLDDYVGFSIIGRCTSVKPSLTKEVCIYPAYKNGPSYKGYKGFPLDLDTWDGSDIFILEHTLCKFVTARTKNVIEKAHLSNIAFEDIAEMTYPQKDAIWKSPMGVMITEQ